MTAVTFALPQESPSSLGDDAAIIHTGVGAASVRQRLPAALDALTSPGFLVASGFAGALDPELKVGDIVVDRLTSDPELRQRAEAAGALLADFTPSDIVVETIAQKAALARRTGAQVVDMETRAIAEICAARHLPFLAVRVISDSATRDFPVPGPVLFDAARQSPRPFALLAHLATRPASLWPFVHFLKDIRQARKSLANYLARLLGP